MFLTYRVNAPITREQFEGILYASGLAERRPVHDAARLQRMLDHANLTLTAWDGERLVGIVRVWNDGGFLAYIADLAVHPDYQGHGIGRELLRRVTSADPEIIYLLHAAPTAMEFYRHTGWRAMSNAWVWPRERMGTRDE